MTQREHRVKGWRNKFPLHHLSWVWKAFLLSHLVLSGLGLRGVGIGNTAQLKKQSTEGEHAVRPPWEVV